MTPASRPRKTGKHTKVTFVESPFLSHSCRHILIQTYQKYADEYTDVKTHGPTTHTRAFSPATMLDKDRQADISLQGLLGFGMGN